MSPAPKTKGSSSIQVNTVRVKSTTPLERTTSTVNPSEGEYDLTSVDFSDLESVSSHLAGVQWRDNNLPKNAGILRILRQKGFINLRKVKVLYPPDENGRVVFAIPDETFNWISAYEMELMNLLSPGSTTANITCSRRSKASDMCYIRVKLQNSGHSKTYGTSLEGELTSNVVPMLTKDQWITACIRVEGCFITSTNQGVMMKLDVFKAEATPEPEEEETLTDSGGNMAARFMRMM